MFHPDFWGKGYCTEALRWFVKQLFEKQPERLVLVAGVHDGNEASLRVLLKCAFVRADSLEGAMGKDDDDDGKSEGMEDFTWFRFERPQIVEE
jgi:RimJ/RimL family protein N-acetyltransferase